MWLRAKGGNGCPGQGSSGYEEGEVGWIILESFLPVPGPDRPCSRGHQGSFPFRVPEFIRGGPSTEVKA
jgi:hypothetical protein